MTHIEVYGQKVKDKETGEFKPCRYCEAAKTYLDKNAIVYVYRDIANINDRKEMFERNPSAKTVPQIFIGERLIGGFDDLAKLPIATLQQMIGE